MYARANPAFLGTPNAASLVVPQGFNLQGNSEVFATAVRTWIPSNALPRDYRDVLAQISAQHYGAENIGVVTATGWRVYGTNAQRGTAVSVAGVPLDSIIIYTQIR